MTDNEGLVYRWTFKIHPLGSLAVVGMCQLRRAISNNFQMENWLKVGHGHYCVYARGLAFSHNDASINCKRKLFNLKTCDVLHF